MAARLSEIDNWNVLLVEAGPDEPAGTQVPSDFLLFLGNASLCVFFFLLNQQNTTIRAVNFDHIQARSWIGIIRLRMNCTRAWTTMAAADGREARISADALLITVWRIIVATRWITPDGSRWEMQAGLGKRYVHVRGIIVERRLWRKILLINTFFFIRYCHTSSNRKTIRRLEGSGHRITALEVRWRLKGTNCFSTLYYSHNILSMIQLTIYRNK